MRQVVYPTALGCGCLMSSTSEPLMAAQWSIEPSYSSSVDYDTNRTLQVDPHSTEATVLSADLRFKRTLETTNWYLEPQYTWRRYSDSKLGNGDERRLGAGFDWAGERNTLNLTGSIDDQSTLQSEVFETGIVNADTHRRLTQANNTWDWNQTERRDLITQVAYSDVTYHGQAIVQLPGYRYWSASVGERFSFSERGSFTVSAYGSTLTTSSSILTPFGLLLYDTSSHEYGLQGQWIHSFSERTHIDTSLGESQRRLLGSTGYGTDASVNLTHDLGPGNFVLSYTRSLVPQGTGILVQRQQYTASAARPLGPYFDGMLSVSHVSNNQAAVALDLERHSYDTVTGTLSWRPTETTSVSGQILGMQTQALGLDTRRVREWRSALTLIWSPRPGSKSW